MIRLTPYPVKHGLSWVRRTHRRQPKIAGAMWCVAAWVGGELRGVALVGKPKARELDSLACDPVEILEVVRVAVVEGTPNACSALYGSCSRAARAMGADGLLTYIHLDEQGISLKAAGWVEDKTTDGGEWGREGRQRELALDANPKRRWWAPWSKALARQARPRSNDEAARRGTEDKT